MKLRKHDIEYRSNGKSVCCNCKKAKVKLYKVKQQVKGDYEGVRRCTIKKHRVRCIARRWKTFSGNEQLKSVIGVRFMKFGDCKAYESMGDNISEFIAELPSTGPEYNEQWLHPLNIFRRRYVR